MKKFLLFTATPFAFIYGEQPQSFVDLREVFFASPIIYSVLLIMSIAALSIWIYSVIAIRKKSLLPKQELDEVHLLLQDKDYTKAIDFCQSSPHFFSKILLSALEMRKQGYQAIAESIKTEGKRHTASFWHRLSLLNDIAIIAPMLGLLGTVMGMFYAFYDINRSFESITSLFDGLGIAVGTTVVGLVVAIIAMILSTTLKYRMIKILSQVENDVIPLTRMIDYGTSTRRRTKA